jgi:hypothetical protein
VNHVLAICHVFTQVRSQNNVFNLRMFGMFSGAFAKLRKATISFVICVCVCVCVCVSAWNNSAPTERICIEFDICIFFENLSREFKFH